MSNAQVEPKKFSYESMGTRWEISIWDEILQSELTLIEKEIISQSKKFDETYSRFKKASLIWQLAEKTGTVEVPTQLIEMLRLYERISVSSRGMVNPLVGFALSDLGYDADYSFAKKLEIRKVPDFNKTLSIIDDTHIELRAKTLIDLGALGKGYFVDRLTEYLKKVGVKRFLVDGSGDIRYVGEGMPIHVGLEHPKDETKVIGVVEMIEGAMCASAGNRRSWGGLHHIINPETLASPTDILAVWVIARDAALADGLATALFFVEPEAMQKDFQFEYLLMNSESKIKRSASFTAELF